MKDTYVKVVHARQATICKKVGPVEKARYGEADDVSGR